MKYKREDELDVHWPDRTVDLGEHTITMRPLTMKYVHYFLRNYAQLVHIAKQSQHNDKAALTAEIAHIIIPLLQYCIHGIDIGDIPIARLPDIIEVWLQQNLNDEIIKKWEALVARLNERLDLVRDSIGQSLSPERLTC